LWQQSPSLFHKRYAVPLDETNTLGSMAPPSSTGQMKGALELSLKGPAGLVAVALEIHAAAVSPVAVRTHPVAGGVAEQPRGIVAGVE
jgi:hypothetical protein